MIDYRYQPALAQDPHWPWHGTTDWPSKNKSTRGLPNPG